MSVKEKILSTVRSLLSDSVADYYGDIDAGKEYMVFDGKFGFYTHEWVVKDFGTEITPFVIQEEATNENQQIAKGIITLEREYAIGFICREELRDDYDAVLGSFYKALNGLVLTTSEGEEIIISAGRFAKGSPYNVGKGDARQRFEFIIGFKAVITPPLLRGRDFNISWDGVELPVRSYRLVSGNGVHSANPSSAEDTANMAINGAEVVVEIVLENDPDPVIKDLLDQTSILKRLSVIKTLEISTDNVAVWNGDAIFTGSQVSFSEFDGVAVAFLYFTLGNKLNNEVAVKIDGYSIPIFNGEQTIKMELLPVNTWKSSATASLQLSRTRAFSFSIPNSHLATYDALRNKLLDNFYLNDLTIAERTFTIEYTWRGGKVYTLNCVIDQNTISISNNGLFSFTLVEGGEL